MAAERRFAAVEGTQTQGQEQNVGVVGVHVPPPRPPTRHALEDDLSDEDDEMIEVLDD